MARDAEGSPVVEFKGEVGSQRYRLNVIGLKAAAALAAELAREVVALEHRLTPLALLGRVTPRTLLCIPGSWSTRPTVGGEALDVGGLLASAAATTEPGRRPLGPEPFPACRADRVQAIEATPLRAAGIELVAAPDA